MKIGVVSDTHSLDVPQEVLKAFKDVDLIVHAGDFCSKKDYDIFSKIGKVKAVFGNMDDDSIRKKLPEKEVFIAEECKIGLFHGEGPPKRVLDFVKDVFKSENLDVVIFGHSHFPTHEKFGNTLYFNPGSPNDIVRAPYCSYGLIEIKGKNVKAKIIKIG